MMRWPGAFIRFLAIALVALACASIYGLLRLATLFTRDRQRRAARVARLRGRILRRAMTTLGATFIKLGQVMSSRPDLFPPEMIDELRKLQDRLPQFSFWRVRRTIERELGGELTDHFVEFDHRAVAAASVAQVHRANLRDGTEVAVKVLRPAVRRQVVRDGGILLGLARALAFLRPSLRILNPVGHLEHFVDGIVAQTDLRNEITNYQRFTTNFADFEGVSFPHVHTELSAATVLTMAFLRGTKIDALGPGTHPRMGKLTREAFFKMCFTDGLIHADLHPGNMLITEDGNLAVFDVGLVKELDHDLLVQLVDFTKCVAMGNTRDLVNHMRRFHSYMEDSDWDEIEKDTQILIDGFRSQNVADLEMGKFTNEVFALARKHNTRPVPDMVLIMVGVITAEGISKMLDPDVNMFNEIATYLLPIIARLGLELDGGAASAESPIG